MSCGSMHADDASVVRCDVVSQQLLYASPGFTHGRSSRSLSSSEYTNERLRSIESNYQGPTSPEQTSDSLHNSHWTRVVSLQKRPRSSKNTYCVGASDDTVRCEGDHVLSGERGEATNTDFQCASVPHPMLRRPT